MLVYRDAARGYGGEHLDDDEYEYVLKREFGADSAIDLSEIVPHVDYFVSFLPAARTALVAQPLIGSREVAHAAASRGWRAMSPRTVRRCRRPASATRRL